jgi:hypothetical protein
MSFGGMAFSFFPMFITKRLNNNQSEIIIKKFPRIASNQKFISKDKKFFKLENIGRIKYSLISL